MFRFYMFFYTIILIYVLVLGWTMFTLFVPYLICIFIFIVIWQLNALNGFSFQLIYAISAIYIYIFFLKRKQITCWF